jgi:acyl transferase domain-containing protein
VAAGLGRRAALRYRLAVAGAGRAELAAGLEAFLAGTEAGGAGGAVAGGAVAGGAGAGPGFAVAGDGGAAGAVVCSGVARAGRKVVFVFPGQGWQWPGMAADLLECSPVFAAAAGECSAAVQALAGFSVLDVLARREGAPGLDRVEVVQPVMFSVMVALAALWQAAGVVPAAVVGHSQGEIAAACVAGALTVAQAAAVVVTRSAALAALAGTGAMASVAAGPARAAALIAGRPALAIAAVNSPAATVVSGPPAAITALLADCDTAGIRARRLAVDYASHSAHIEPVAAALLAGLDGLAPAPAAIAVHSTLTGQRLDTTTMTARYWYDNLRRTVQFDTATRNLLRTGHDTFIEISAHPVLTPALHQIADTTPSRPAIFGTLHRDHPGPAAFTTATATAWTHGLPAAPPDRHRPCPPATTIPTYAFDHHHYWLRNAGTGPADGPADQEFWAAVERQDAAALAAALELDEAAARAALQALLPGLGSWWDRRRERAAIGSWRYRIAWKPVPDEPAPSVPGRWLVIVPAAQAAHQQVTACLRLIAAHGGEPCQLVVDSASNDPAELASAIEAAADGVPPRGVLSLLGLDETWHPGQPADSLVSAVHLIQALQLAGIDAVFWSATSGAVATTPGDAGISPVQAQLWGLLRVADLESQHRTVGLVDLPESIDDRAGARLCQILAGASGEDQLAVRANGIFARRLIPVPPGDQPPARTWRPRGTTVITGGTGGLGGQLARQLAGGGAEHLLLLSRRGPRAAGAAELEAELTALGAAVTITSCDITDRDALASVLARVPERYPLASVIHAAGESKPGRPVAELTVAELADVIAGKVTGAANLCDVLGRRPLDAFVLYSSGAGVWGSAGQGAYAAANAYLDALAQRRRAAGLTATSVAWGAWAGGGMVDNEEYISWLGRSGMRLMAPAAAIAALRQAIDDDETCIAVADIDWPRFAEVYTAARSRPLIGDIPAVVSALAPAGGTAAAEPDRALAARLSGLPAAHKESLLLDIVCARLARVLRHAEADAIDPDRPFHDFGLDSISGVELRDGVAAATGIKLPATAIFDYPTPVALARCLCERLAGTGAEPPAASVADVLRQLQDVLEALPADDAARDEAVAGLRNAAARFAEGSLARRADGQQNGEIEVETATDDELFELIDRGFER